jgi:hypothetical protein
LNRSLGRAPRSHLASRSSLSDKRSRHEQTHSGGRRPPDCRLSLQCICPLLAQRGHHDGV